MYLQASRRLRLPRPSSCPAARAPWCPRRAAQPATGWHPPGGRRDLSSITSISSASKSGPYAKTATADPQPDRDHRRLVSAQRIRFRRRVASARLNWNQVTIGKRPVRRRIIGLPPFIRHEPGWRTCRKVPILVHPIRIAVPALGSHIHLCIVTLANIAQRSPMIQISVLITRLMQRSPVGPRRATCQRT